MGIIQINLTPQDLEQYWQRFLAWKYKWLLFAFICVLCVLAVSFMIKKILMKPVPTNTIELRDNHNTGNQAIGNTATVNQSIVNQPATYTWENPGVYEPSFIPGTGYYGSIRFKRSEGIPPTEVCLLIKSTEEIFATPEGMKIIKNPRKVSWKEGVNYFFNTCFNVSLPKETILIKSSKKPNILTAELVNQ